jgi:DNA-binding NtrC family response regulator
MRTATRYDGLPSISTEVPIAEGRARPVLSPSSSVAISDPNGWFEEAPPEAVAAPSTTFYLTVREGVDVGAAIAVDDAGRDIVVGTSEGCGLRLADPGVSRWHLRLEVHGGRLRVRDTASTNGTFINGLRTVEAYLEGGECIRIGDTVLTVERPARDQLAPNEDRFGSFIGSSLAIRRLYPLIAKVAGSDVPLVIEGETGTGKEALAEAIHESGSRAGKPFVVFDCTAVPPSLLEAALFGHERGAYTGADVARPGIFEEADGGTLLIDEIGDLDLGLQSRLLRAIQKSEVRRIGGNRWIRVDVRVIAATRRDLDAEVAAGRFRDDLFFRLAVARMTLPPLRKRPEDVEHLARHFWAVHTRELKPFPEEVLPRLRSHTWPGNVRELSNTMARLGAFGAEEEQLFALRSTPPAGLTVESPTMPPASDVGGPDFIDSIVEKQLTLAAARDLVVAEFEKRYITSLDATHRNERARATVSGVSGRYLRTLRGRAREGM